MCHDRLQRRKSHMCRGTPEASGHDPAQPCPQLHLHPLLEHFVDVLSAALFQEQDMFFQESSTHIDQKPACSYPPLPSLDTR